MGRREKKETIQHAALPSTNTVVNTGTTHKTFFVLMFFVPHPLAGNAGSGLERARGCSSWERSCWVWEPWPSTRSSFHVSSLRSQWCVFVLCFCYLAHTSEQSQNLPCIPCIPCPRPGSCHFNGIFFGPFCGHDKACSSACYTLPSTVVYNMAC